jgi:geranylgeranyl transferase type-2 subunit beta
MPGQMTPFLLQLAEWLQRGMAQLDPSIKSIHRAFILQQQREDGGFINRFGETDLYYSSFAVRALQLLGDVPDECLSHIERYLKLFNVLELSTIDMLNWIQMALALQIMTGREQEAFNTQELSLKILERLESCRLSDGGYAKAEQGTLGSTYHSFLTLLVYELLGQEIPEPARLLSFLRNQQRDDGGFVEIAPVKLSGTNPTAAAVVTLHQLSGLNPHDSEDVGGFLGDVWNADGGYSANSRIPFPDALSTFTALITLRILNQVDQEKMKRIRNLLTSQLQFPTGGFRAAMWDEQVDLEYTFYGLGCLALTQ